MDEDLFRVDSGLFSDYEGKVVDAWFGNDSRVGNGQVTILFLKMMTDVPEHPEWTERYTCGPDWQTIDGGKTVVHPTSKVFNANSQAGRLTKKALELAEKELRARGIPPTDHRCWLGTSWFMQGETKSGKLQDGTEYTSTRNLPTKFLGIDTNVVAGSQEGTVGGGDHTSGINPAVMNQMGELAKSLTHPEWVDRVMELDGVTANEELVIQLTDENGLYAQLRG